MCRESARTGRAGEASAMATPFRDVSVRQQGIGQTDKIDKHKKEPNTGETFAKI